MRRHAIRRAVLAGIRLAGILILGTSPVWAQAPQAGHTVIGDPALPVRPIDSPAPVSSLSPSGPMSHGPNPSREIGAPGSSTGAAGPLNATPYSGGPTGGPAGGLSTDPSITGNHEVAPGEAR